MSFKYSAFTENTPEMREWLEGFRAYMKDLNKLSKEIYEANKVKGFHEETYSHEHMLCLVISELMEAVEVDRRGRELSMIGCKNDFDINSETSKRCYYDEKLWVLYHKLREHYLIDIWI